MGVTVFLLFLIIFLVFYIIYIIAKKFEKITIEKGYSIEETHSFAMVFWLGIIGILYVIALPDRNSHK